MIEYFEDERVLICGVLLRQPYGRHEQIGEWPGKVIKDEFNLLPEFLRPELYRVLLEYGVLRLQNPVDCVAVSRLEVDNHLATWPGSPPWSELRPILRLLTSLFPTTILI